MPSKNYNTHITPVKNLENKENRVNITTSLEMIPPKILMYLFLKIFLPTNISSFFFKKLKWSIGSPGSHICMLVCDPCQTIIRHWTFIHTVISPSQYSPRTESSAYTWRLSTWAHISALPPDSRVRQAPHLPKPWMRLREMDVTPGCCSRLVV